MRPAHPALPSGTVGSTQGHIPAGNRKHDCGPGLSCDTTMKKCFNNPRAAGEPCKGAQCATGLTCDTTTNRCRAPAAYNEPCKPPPAADLPCTSGLSCHPGRNVCKNLPRQDNEPCTDPEGKKQIVKCADGLACEVGVSNECQPMGTLGSPCHATLPCQEGYSCHPFIRVNAAGFCRQLPTARMKHV